MYNFYNTRPPEKRNAWRNAYEIKAAALEHEKRRFLNEESSSLAKPQVLVQDMGRSRSRSRWEAVLKAPARLIAILMG